MIWEIVSLVIAFLFGFYMATRVKNIEKLMRSIIKEIRTLRKTGFKRE